MADSYWWQDQVHDRYWTPEQHVNIVHPVRNALNGEDNRSSAKIVFCRSNKHMLEPRDLVKIGAYQEAVLDKYYEDFYVWEELVERGHKRAKQPKNPFVEQAERKALDLVRAEAKERAAKGGQYSKILQELKEEAFRNLEIEEILEPQRWVQSGYDRKDEDRINMIARAYQNDLDIYFTQQTFFGCRRSKNLAELGCNYVDIDGPFEGGKNVYEVATEVLQLLYCGRKPLPSYVMFTGVGICLVWLHHKIPCIYYSKKQREAALASGEAIKQDGRGRWLMVNTFMSELVQELSGYVTDKSVNDFARVLRLAGSVNSKSKEICRPIWVNGEDDHAPHRYNFEELAKGYLPFDRPGWAKWKEGKSTDTALVVKQPPREGKATRKRDENGKYLTVSSYYQTILNDLQKLVQGRWEGEVPPGFQDKYLFIQICCLAWTTNPAAARAEVDRLARVFLWNEAEAQEVMQTALARQKAAWSGEKATWDGTDVDPRYKLSAKKLVELMNVTREESVRSSVYD